MLASMAGTCGPQVSYAARLRGGTLAPERRASLRPIAMACLRLLTFRPLLPERSLPRLNSRISSPTFCCAFRPYFLPELRRERVELPLRDELRRDRDDVALVPRCAVLLRLPVVRRRDLELRVERELDELFARDRDVDLRVAMVSSLLHTQTTAGSCGLRSRQARLYRRSPMNIE